MHLGIQGGHADVCRFLMEEKADLQQALDFGALDGRFFIGDFGWYKNMVKFSSTYHIHPHPSVSNKKSCFFEC